MIGNDSQLSTNINISRTMGRKGGGCVHRIYPYLIFCSQSNYYRISAKQNGRSIFHTLCFVLSRITNEIRRRKKTPHLFLSIANSNRPKQSAKHDINTIRTEMHKNIIFFSVELLMDNGLMGIVIVISRNSCNDIHHEHSLKKLTIRKG